MDWIMPFIWFLLGVLLIVTEFIFPGFVVFFFGVGALIVGIINLIFPGLQGLDWLWLNILMWLGFSGATLAIFRRFFKKVFTGSSSTKGSSRDEIVGKRAQVVEDITPDNQGRVRFMGTSWTAIAYNEHIKKGEWVDILQKDNLTLVVSKLGDEIEDEFKELESLQQKENEKENENLKDPIQDDKSETINTKMDNTTTDDATIKDTTTIEENRTQKG